MEQRKVNLRMVNGEVLDTFMALPYFNVGETIKFRNSTTRTLFTARIASINHDIVSHKQSAVHEVNLTLDQISEEVYPFPS